MAAFFLRRVWQRAIFTGQFLREQASKHGRDDQCEERVHPHDGDKQNNRRETDAKHCEWPERSGISRRHG